MVQCLRSSGASCLKSMSVEDVSDREQGSDEETAREQLARKGLRAVVKRGNLACAENLEKLHRAPILRTVGSSVLLMLPSIVDNV